MASNLCYVVSKKQLKKLGTKNELLEFLSQYFGVESNKFSTLDNGTCLVLSLAKSRNNNNASLREGQR